MDTASLLLDPIDIVESLATDREWEFDRTSDDQITMSVKEKWRTYVATLAWSTCDDTLRMIVTFEFEPPEEKLLAVYELLNIVNDKVWTGAFSFWESQSLMTYRYGLILAQEQLPVLDQIDRVIGTAVLACERYYPAFQLVVRGDHSAEEALKVAINEAYGRV